MVTLVAEKVFPAQRARYNTVVFSNLPRLGKQRPLSFYQTWERQYARFNAGSKRTAAKYPLLLEMDLTSFYDMIDHRLLLSEVRRYLSDVYLLELLERMLGTWTMTIRNGALHTAFRKAQRGPASWLIYFFIP